MSPQEQLTTLSRSGEDALRGAAHSALSGPEGQYLVLVNAHGQHSLWPIMVDVPDGWEIAYSTAGRTECLDYVESHWAEMRPKCLAERLFREGSSRSGGPWPSH